MKSFVRQCGSKPRPVRGWSLLLLAVALTACSMAAAPPVPGTPIVSAPTVPEATTDVTAKPMQANQALPASSTAETTPGPVRTIVLVTTEVDAGLDLVQSVAATFGAATGWTIQVAPKDSRELRVDLETAALAGQMPDLIWTHGEHLGSLAANELLRPVDDLVQLADYSPVAVAAANTNGIQWGVPIVSGDHLVLFHNRGWVPEPPATTDALLALSKPEGAEVLLAADQLSPAWLAAWLTGFDGTAPVSQTHMRLNPTTTVSTLFFLKELRGREIIPGDMDAGSATEAFRSGRATMLVASAWSLAALTGVGGDGPRLDLAIAPLPIVAASGQPPRPYTSGMYLSVSAAAADDEIDIARQLAAFLASPEIQARVATELKRLPATNAALQDERVRSDPHIRALIAGLSGTVPLPMEGIPRVLEASIPILAATLNGEKAPEEAAEEIRSAAEESAGEKP